MEGKASEEAAVCYSHKELEARREREGRREERGGEAGRPEPKKDHEPVRA